MTRPGSLVHAEHEARDDAERHGWDEDYLPEREPVEHIETHPIEAVEAAIDRARARSPR